MKTKIKNQILAMVMSLVMVFGLTSGFSVAAEDTVTTITMTAGCFGGLHSQSSGVSQDNRNNRILLTMTDAGKDTASAIKETSSTTIYTMSPKDENSGVYFGEVRTLTTMRYISSGQWRIGASFKGADGTNKTAVAGDIVTIKGTFTTTVGETVYDVVMPTMQFRYVDDGTTGWEILPIALDMSAATFTVNSSSASNLLYLNGSNYPDGTDDIKVSSNSSAHFYASETDADSGIWLESTKLYAKILIQKSGLMQIGGFYNLEDKATKVDAIEGNILIIKGTFAVTLSGQPYEIIMPEMQFQYTSEGWVAYEESTTTTIEMTTEDFSLHTQSSKVDALATRIYLAVSDDGKTKATPIQNCVLSAKDDNSGIYLGETKTQTTMKFQNDGHWVIGANFKDAAGATTTPVQGTIVTVKGTFTTTVGEQVYELVMPEMQFRYVSDGTVGWEVYVPTITLDMSTATFTVNGSSASNLLYLNGSNYPDGTDDIKVSSNSSAHFYASETDADSGIWLESTKLYAKILIQKSGLMQIGGFYNLEDKATKVDAIEGNILIIKGTFAVTLSGQPYEIIMPEMQFQYTSNGWITYYDDGDYNGDRVIDIRDLVRLKCYLSDNTVTVATGAGFGENDSISYSEDKAMLYSLLLGEFTVDAASGVTLGMPVYSTTLSLERMAYSSPEIGTWSSSETDGTNTFTAYDEEVIDASFQKYKAAGFTLLSSRGTAKYRTSENGGTQAIDVFMEAAQRNGLGVLVDFQYVDIVRDAYANNRTDLIPGLEKASTVTGFDYYYEGIIYNQVMNAVKKPAFAGVILSDEWKASEADLYKRIVAAVRKAEEDAKADGLLTKAMIITTSQLPIYAYDETTEGAANLTTDETKQTDKATAYKDYISNFASTGIFTYDSYRLHNNVLSGADVSSDWYDNLKYVAEAGIQHTGVTIQSCALGNYYAPTQKSDIGFQVYTALAYGMKEINHYCYGPSSSDTITAWIMNNTEIYTAVQGVNEELDKFAHVLMYYRWKGALDLEACTSGSGADANSSRLATAEVSGARAIVGCMKDVFGYDGYMVANAAGPRTTTPSSVTLTFDNADSVIVYRNGVPTTAVLSDGAITLEVGVGEGVFVIPVVLN